MSRSAVWINCRSCDKDNKLPPTDLKVTNIAGSVMVSFSCVGCGRLQTYSDLDYLQLETAVAIGVPFVDMKEAL